MSWKASAERENILCLNIIKGGFKSDWGLTEDANHVFFLIVFFVLSGCFQRFTHWFEQTDASFLLIRYQGKKKMVEELRALKSTAHALFFCILSRQSSVLFKLGLFRDTAKRKTLRLSDCIILTASAHFFFFFKPL